MQILIARVGEQIRNYGFSPVSYQFFALNWEAEGPLGEDQIVAKVNHLADEHGWEVDWDRPMAQFVFRAKRSVDDPKTREGEA